MSLQLEILPDIPEETARVASAAFVKCCNKTDWPLEPYYVVLCDVYAASAFNERSTSTSRAISALIY
jgi:hypothetical protein